MSSDGDPVMMAAFGSVGGVVAFFRGFWKLKALRRIENTPTSTVRSMPMGLVELHGFARVEEPLIAPFTGKPVALYRVEIEEYRGGKNSRWVTVHKDSSSEPFWLEDDTGKVLVLPDGADLHLPTDYQENFRGTSLPADVESYMDQNGIRTRTLGFGKSLRFTEWHIEADQEFYLHGVGQERPDLREIQRERISDLLRNVREDPEMMKKLDLDGDGRVDAEEWDQARQLAVGKVRGEGIADRVVVAKGGKKDLFLISDRSEHDLVKRLRWETALYVFGGGAAFVAGTAYLAGWFGLI
jgi:hypothetical protein